MKDPRKTVFRLNREDVRFDALPKDLQDHMILAHDFYTKLDAARSHEDRQQLLATHPFNQ